MKHSLFVAAFIGLFAVCLRLAVVGYECKPYKPTEECDAGRYEALLLEQMNLEPIAIIEAECIYTRKGRYKAERVEFTTKNRAPESHDFLEIPTRNVKVCKVE